MRLFWQGAVRFWLSYQQVINSSAGRMKITKAPITTAFSEIDVLIFWPRPRAQWLSIPVDPRVRSDIQEEE